MRKSRSKRNALRVALCGISTVSMLGIGVTSAFAESDAYSIARGARLYDKWFKESKSANKPETAHPSYPESGKYRAKKAADWRCKECHGWDYKGADGAYASGKHFTGIKGINGMTGAKPTQIVNALKDSTHALADSGLTESDYNDLAMFVSKGQIISYDFISTNNKAVTGDKKLGQSYYETVCASCHGLDGKEEDEAPPLGKLANDNPWEVLHKILNGQPDSEMPALRAFDKQVSVDILAHLQTLPKE